MGFGKRSTAAEVVKNLDLTGRYFLVTGANTGIGYETAKALALQNGHVTITCRTAEKTEATKNKILKEKPDAKVDVLTLENEDLKSVEACAKEYLNRKQSKVQQRQYIVQLRRK